jgi:hypothetical protein
MDTNTIDPRFVDADFRTFPEYVPGDVRPENMAELCASMPEFEAAAPLIPSSQYKEIADETQAKKLGLEFLIRWVLNQGREGSCVGNAAVAMVMMILAKQFGKAFVTALSAISLYQLIGRSPSSGAMVPDALDKLKAVGAIPLDTPENRAKFGSVVMPATGFYSKRPSGWEQVAANFKIDEFFVIRSYEGLISALLSGNPVVVGRQGHSICYVGVVFVNGKLYVLYVNSWGGNWGLSAGLFPAGFGLDSVSTVRQASGWAFTARSIVVPAG